MSYVRSACANWISAGLCAVGLCLASAAKGSTGIDVCQDPSRESHLTIAYYEQEESPFEQAPGRTNRDDFRTDLLFAATEQWSFGFGHRSAILNVDDLKLQTNGYLHSFFFPLHWTRQAEGSSFRFSVAPVLSGSSNVTKDPGEYSRDALQLLAAMVWSRPVSDRLDLSYGICGDHRLGGYQVYPAVSLEWQPHPDWSVELGFPASQLSYQIAEKLDSSLRISPNGNEWFVKDKTLTKSSVVIYEAYLVEWVLNWRLHERFMMTASVGTEIDAQYEVTLIDDSRVRLSSESTARIGFAVAWFF